MILLLQTLAKRERHSTSLDLAPFVASCYVIVPRCPALLMIGFESSGRADRAGVESE